jgi:MurNAc alpha-1-phosphate uridylyltransferase
MKAMILAAGRGERMRPLTDNCPKPLLKVKGISLIEYHIKNLVLAGIKDIVINHAWLGQKLVDYLGRGERYSAKISYSEEPVALETAGGILKALPLLAEQDDDVFAVINGDIYCDYSFQQLPKLLSHCNAHLILVANPEHNMKGDFQLDADMLINPNNTKQETYTFSGIALYRKGFFKPYIKASYEENSEQHTIQPLAPMLRAAADARKISASVIDSAWTDVGTPERLAKLNRD